MPLAIRSVQQRLDEPLLMSSGIANSIQGGRRSVLTAMLRIVPGWPDTGVFARLGSIAQVLTEAERMHLETPVCTGALALCSLGRVEPNDDQSHLVRLRVAAPSPRDHQSCRPAHCCPSGNATVARAGARAPKTDVNLTVDVSTESWRFCGKPLSG